MGPEVAFLFYYQLKKFELILDVFPLISVIL